MDGKKGKGIVAAGGALVLALAGAWMGIDLTGDGGNDGEAASSGGTETTTATTAAPATGSSASGEVCSIDTLPPQADDVVDRILTDQDHVYSAHDGKHFGNYEGLLPRESGDFYREYTVDTPGLNHRGARRIVVGGGTDVDPDVWFYTDDHYESFCEIPDAED
ncbi:ribonuclease domain-containing protein [uncultured Corynebacterium sp.]|uniref:ribonuclease domain-containing protein n=1 Tax=uncultured Corynebacterium sp. TaxID=159447 RepID=UPI0025E0615B|nr:ribonuclease domain-containing protein [uncultured Corynebacterium sp.]